MKNQLRREKTIAQIDQAFLKLIQNKFIEEIFVADIAREAGISRATFYSYYPSVGKLADEAEDRYLQECMDGFKAYGMLLRDPGQFFTEFNRCFAGKSRILRAFARGRQDKQDLKIIRLLVRAGKHSGSAAEETCLTMLVSGLLTIQKQYLSSASFRAAMDKLQGTYITISYSNNQVPGINDDQLQANGGSLIPYAILDNPHLIGTR